MNVYKNLETVIKEFSPNIVIDRLLPAREGKYAPFPDGLDYRLTEALKKRGIEKLYTHQAEVWKHSKENKNVVVVTPTASGKTLCYNLPCLDTLLREDTARCLYLFPTKALSQDQQSELNEIIGTDGGNLNLKVATYDGDTPDSLRVSARDKGRIIISNPDMLHTGILPNHPKWIKFFSNLKYIVIDEAHAYRGVFGSHVANVIRRLRRVCAFYNAYPRFILCSATIGNPKELAASLIGEDIELVDKNGSPSGEKRIILYNPPLVDKVQGIRRSVVTESRRWMTALLKANIKTILFAHSRVRTEVAASYVNEDLKNIFTDNSRIKVEAYRGGFLPNERREIEKGLREGSIHGVVSTNALELGIDIGGLDASIIAGFPGSFNSFWQQSGRAGRRGGTSVSVFIASVSPLDQFIMNDPEWFFRKNAEVAMLDPDNPYILTDHVKCACFELPFAGIGEWGIGNRENGFKYEIEENNAKTTNNNPDSPLPASCLPYKESFSQNTKEVLEYLEEAGIVRHTNGKWHWADRSYPSEGVSLRSAGADNIVIIDITEGRNTVIGEMDRPSAKELIFVNAVYIHRGRQFMVEELDINNRKCLVRETEVNYFTDGLVKTDIKVLSEDEKRRVGNRELGAENINLIDSDDNHSLLAVQGDVLVRSQVTKFKKLKFRTHENIGYGDINLPEEEMQTRTLALLFPDDSCGGKILKNMDEQEAGEVLSGMGTLIRNIAPVFLLCDPKDLGIAERVRDPHFQVPALYIYDKYPGGTGLTENLMECVEKLILTVKDALDRCPCKTGCPSCVGPSGNKDSCKKLMDVISCPATGQKALKHTEKD